MAKMTRLSRKPSGPESTKTKPSSNSPGRATIGTATKNTRTLVQEPENRKLPSTTTAGLLSQGPSSSSIPTSTIEVKNTKNEKTPLQQLTEFLSVQTVAKASERHRRIEEKRRREKETRERQEAAKARNKKDPKQELQERLERRKQRSGKGTPGKPKRRVKQSKEVKHFLKAIKVGRPYRRESIALPSPRLVHTWAGG